MPKETHYDYGYCTVRVIRPDISKEESEKRLSNALIRFYLGCLDEGVDITKNDCKGGGKRANT